MAVKLYWFALSHPAQAARLMLDHKGVEYERVDLLPGLHPLQVRRAGFDGGTVPAIVLDDGRKVQGTLEISRALEELTPDPPLFPADPARRKQVEDAERWGESVLQPVPRRLFRWAASRSTALRTQLARGVGLPLPGVVALANWPITRWLTRQAGADDERIQADLTELPSLIDHVDELIATGVIGGPERNAADFQIATAVRTLLNFDEARPVIEGRPAERHSRDIFPNERSGSMSLGVPEAWIPGR